MKALHLSSIAQATATGEPWLKADLFFLSHALRHGMSIERVAGFLGKPADEVRAKAHQLNSSRTVHLM